MEQNFKGMALFFPLEIFFICLLVCLSVSQGPLPLSPPLIIQSIGNSVQSSSDVQMCANLSTKDALFISLLSGSHFMGYYTVINETALSTTIPTLNQLFTETTSPGLKWSISPTFDGNLLQVEQSGIGSISCNLSLISLSGTNSLILQNFLTFNLTEDANTLITCSDSISQCLIYSVVKYLNGTTVGSYLFVDANGTITMNETIDWTDPSGRNLTTFRMVSVPNGTFIVITVANVSSTQYSFQYRVLFANGSDYITVSIPNNVQNIYGFDAIAINATHFLFIVSTNSTANVYLVAIGKGPIQQPAATITPTQMPVYFPTLQHIGRNPTNYVALWWAPEDNVAMNAFNIYGQLLTSQGLVGNMFRVNDVPVSNITPTSAPSVATFDSGDFAVVWAASSFLLLRGFNWSPCPGVPLSPSMCDEGAACNASCVCTGSSSGSSNPTCPPSPQHLCTTGTGCAKYYCATGYQATIPPSAQCLSASFSGPEAITALGGPFLISPNDTNVPKESPAAALVISSTNVIVVVWVEGQQTVSGIAIDIFGRALTSPFVLQSGSSVLLPAVSSRWNAFAVVWSQLNTTDNYYYPFVSYFDPSGRPLSLPIPLNSTGSNQEFILTLADLAFFICVASLNQNTSTLTLEYLDLYGTPTAEISLSPSDSPAPQVVDFADSQQLLCVEVNGTLFLYVLTKNFSTDWLWLSNSGVCGDVATFSSPITNETFAAIVINNGSLVVEFVSVSNITALTIVSELVAYSPNASVTTIANIMLENVSPVTTNNVTNVLVLTWTETLNTGQTGIVTQIIYVNDSMTLTDPFYMTTIVSAPNSSLDSSHIDMIPIFLNRFLVVWSMNGLIYGQAFEPAIPPPPIPIVSTPVGVTAAPTTLDATTILILETVVPTGGGLIIIAAAVVLVVLLVLYKRRKKKKGTRAQEAANDDVKTNYGTIPREDTAKIVWSELAQKDRAIPYKELQIISDIGSGAYGKVCLGKWRGVKVAIKVAKDVVDIDDFFKEALLMIAIRPHPNVLQVLGVCIDGPNPAIVMEYCPRGSLDRLLLDTSQTISDELRHQLILGIAKGMLHLHLSNVVHRDLAARNILLSADGQPKISDFGMSRVMTPGQEVATTKANIGPIKWMAPESLKHRVYSRMSDVWSFGIVMYEIISRKLPHENEDDLLEIAVKIRDQGLTPPIPEGCPPLYEQIMRACWKYNPDERPTFEQIIAMLEGSEHHVALEMESDNTKTVPQNVAANEEHKESEEASNNQSEQSHNSQSDEDSAQNSGSNNSNE
jgi:serine/threonine protein kinase